jgi:hypothetical protein
MNGQTTHLRSPIVARVLVVLIIASFAASSILGGPVQSVGAAQATTNGTIGNPSPFGVVADLGTRFGVRGEFGKPAELLAASGAKWVKEEFRWETVQPSRDRWTWDFMDAAVNEEKARGLEILGLLDYTAGWAVGEPQPLSITPPPHDLWANYVAQTVGRYKDRVHAWEVWNEPNEPVFWSGSKEQFAALLAVTYDTIKRVDPTATVLGPTITGVDEAWLDAMPWDKFDVLALHMYVPPASLNDQGYSYYDQGLPNLERVVKRRGNKPIWITEFGYSSQGGGHPWFVNDEQSQARYLIQHTAQTLAYSGLNIERVMPYVFNNHDGFELVRDWSRPKPAFYAYRTMTERLTGAEGIGRVSNAGPGVMAFRFARGGQQIAVVWAPKGGTATLLSGGDAEVYDLYGKRTVVAQQGGMVKVPVGQDPVYVVHAPGGGSSSLPGGASRTFAETGKTVRGPFLAHWQAHGGLAIYGFPLSDEFVEVLSDGKPYTVQYFERARFEWHPENPPAYQVLLGQFGRQLHPLYPPVPDCRCGLYFPETGHNIAGSFRDYWEKHGGLAQFGYPITDEVTETLEDGKQYRVQWFERARFEFHPENPAPYDILLGQFGRRIYDSLQR